ncbi:MAG: hypothetical protein IJ808_03655 [Muribaculaceae bacterium]|nr:hypothetical protein [Muribaculaceae bacterium]
MITREEIVEIGRLTKLHGVAGEMSAAIQVDPDVFNELQCVVIDVEGLYVPFFISSNRPFGATSALLMFEDVASQSEATPLLGKTLFALKNDYEHLVQEFAEESQQFPLDYFVGFTISDADENIGEIIGVNSDTINYLWQVKLSDGTIASIPAADDLVQDIDLDSRTITMTLPQGLLELN